MSVRTRGSVFLAACLALLACSKYGNVSGRVVNGLSDSGMAGVTVQVSGTSLRVETDSNGNYQISHVIPGTQTVSARLDGYMAAESLELVVAKRTVTQASNIHLVPRPPLAGVFTVSDSAVSSSDLDRVPESGWTGDLIPAELVPQYGEENSLGTNVRFLIYEGDDPPRNLGITLVPLRDSSVAFHGPFQITRSYYYVRGSPLANVELRRLSRSIAILKAELQDGRYCVRVQHEHGVGEWHYCFGVISY